MARNVVANDYCLIPCVQSLLGVCDEVVIGYSSSTDDTEHFIRDFADRDSRIRVEHVEADFSTSAGGAQWMIDWMDGIRRKLRGEYQIQLDCDEVLADWSYPRVRYAAERGESIVCNRLNFWGRLNRITPHGYFCGNRIIRAAPSGFTLASDFPVDLPVLDHAVETDVDIFHYCTLRNQAAFMKKSKEFHKVLIGKYDTRIDEAFLSNAPHWSDWFTFPKPFIDYPGKHPAIAHQWLRERGYDPVP